MTYEAFPQKSLDCLEETFDRNMDVTGAFGEDSERNEESIIEKCWKGDPYYIVAKELTELFLLLETH